MLGQPQRPGEINGCSQKTCQMPSSLISGPLNFRESHRCCSKERASLSFAKYLNGIYCAGEGAALIHRNCQVSHFYPDLWRSPSSPVMCTFLSFKDSHKRHLQSIHSPISTWYIFSFTKHVIHFYKVCVYFDFPLTETTCECCHFVSQTFSRVHFWSRLLKQKCNLNKSAKNQLRKACTAVALTEENCESQKEGVNLCRNSTKQSLLLQLLLYRDLLQQTASLGNGRASPTDSQFSKGQTLSAVL